MPVFQRQYVWSMEQIEKLWDSILLDYPIATFLFWHVDDDNVTWDTYFCNFLSSVTFISIWLFIRMCGIENRLKTAYNLKKHLLVYTYSQNNYKKKVTKQMDTWLDAVRNLRNYCAHHSMVVGMTSSVVIPDNRDSADVLPDNTNLYLRLYALKKILPQKDADMLAEELEKLISKTKIDMNKMNVLPANWKELYDKTLFL